MTSSNVHINSNCSLKNRLKGDQLYDNPGDSDSGWDLGGNRGSGGFYVISDLSGFILKVA